nr:hypothetical protein [Duganella sp. BJB1802]
MEVAKRVEAPLGILESNVFGCERVALNHIHCVREIEAVLAQIALPLGVAPDVPSYLSVVA